MRASSPADVDGWPASRSARSSSTGDRAGSVEIAPDEVPGLIDELPAIAALAAHGGEVTVRGAGELRVKESDRITTLVTGFRDLGIDADEHADGFTVHGVGRARRAASPTPEAITAWRWPSPSRRSSAQRPSHIEGADAVVISYPGFFETLQRLVA